MYKPKESFPVYLGMSKRKAAITTIRNLIVLLFLIEAGIACKQTNKTMPKANKNHMKTTHCVDKKQFDTIVDGKGVTLFWLKRNGIEVAITNYGARIVSLLVPDKNGNRVDVNMGWSTIKEYLASHADYYGATIGRVGNRIANGKFDLNGVTYTIPTNNNGNALHGGHKGFQAVVWQAEKENGHRLVLRYVSPHMEEGFPGELTTKVTYELQENAALKISYEATTDRPTMINLTNHAYFNLNGEGSGTILHHRLQLFADAFTPVNAELIPTGEIRKVKGTPFDFTTPKTIGKHIDSENEQLRLGGGYDHNYVLNSPTEGDMRHAARVVGDQSGILMDVYTMEPGIQLYTGNFMDAKRTALCLETQHFPDAPNQPNFPSIQLDPGTTYKTTSEYHFSLEN